MRDPLLGAALRAAVDAAFETEQVPLLQRLVDLPSHTYARDDVEIAAAALDEAAVAVGLTCTKIPDPSGRFADHRVYADPSVGDGPSLALVGHIDTVFPRSLGFLSFRRDGDVARGPGVLDMKSGLTSVIFALRALRAVTPARASVPVRFIVVSDEEVGSPSSAAMYRELAPRLTGALVFESGREGDTIVTRRKGGGLFTISVRGRAAHAGNNHHKGVNAIHALALLVDRVERLTDYSRGVTLNVGLIEGGTAKNTVPASAKCQVDARFETVADAQRVADFLAALQREPFAGLADVPERLREVVVEVSGGITRPPMEASAASQRLRGVYEPYAAACGLQVGECPLQGGGSDANLLAADGVPCVDGLGPYGQHFHETEEWCSLDSLRRRTAALACFLAEEAGTCFR
ncbi:M20/M25/M40 family metallo-hydrolase [Nannocystis punicea]|uniref:M20/M25/M40 family metallo-hydrolase n=1 Tax=Nannocystis punicea TaxID=2995304 RepID=A0ABY7HEU0_9BACT|nr:M20/M25/M40 family metallo-hydrolase [Nannocystis poenicansa]WAS97600.1 M20/M25/M40 family metallo-hydrolase [Nannocystis poenicansa]